MMPAALLADSTTRSLVVLALALALDVVVGEYPNALHPVVWIGSTVSALQRAAPTRGRVAPFFYGLALAVTIPSAFAAAAWGVLRVASVVPIAEVLVAALLFKATFAVRALGRAAFAVRGALRRGDLDEARLGLRSLCSRDPRPLGAEALAAATVESVAENASDSFVAPLFFFALFGLPGAVFYRAVNTLDAMIGYHGKYEYLGKASARLDDLLNFVPARLTALSFLAAGALLRADVRHGFHILLRDGPTTESPNAGRPMAAMAGLLRVGLAKPGHYLLGDELEAVTFRTIDRAWRIVVVAVVLVLASYGAALFVFHEALHESYLPVAV